MHCHVLSHACAEEPNARNCRSIGLAMLLAPVLPDMVELSRGLLQGYAITPVSTHAVEAYVDSQSRRRSSGE